MKRLMSLILFAAAAVAQGLGPKTAGSRNVAILIFPGVQIIDYTGPWEVLGHAYVNNQPAFRIYTVAESKDPITTSMGMSVNPTFTFASAPKADLIVLPGGNVSPQLDDPAVIRWVRDSARDAEIVFSVCNGAFFLARAGLLDGLEATTFAGLIDELKEAAPKTHVVSDKRFVDNGKIVTAAGLSSGIDGALHVIEKLFGKGTAQVAAVSLEYNWQPDSGWARASLADRQLSAGFDAIREYPRTVVRHEGTRDRWQTSWKIETQDSAAAVRERLDRAFGETKSWARQGNGSWRSNGEGGAVWTEATQVQPLEHGGKGYLVTMTVSRAM